MNVAPQHNDPVRGAQRLDLEALRAWQRLEYGMFIHFGMSTFDGVELSRGDQPSTLYAPDRLDVDQWIQVARDAGVKYAVLTAKHVAGHCLWPTRHNDYHVGTSGNKTDVVEAFVRACDRHGIMPGLYYCSLDKHNVFGYDERCLPNATYVEFQLAQVEELLTRYGKIGEVWIDIPPCLDWKDRRRQYDQIARLQPQAVIMMNHGFGNGSQLNVEKVWPTDLMAIERWLPNSHRGYNPWFTIPRVPQNGQESLDYYIPGEVCDPIGYEWFDVEGDKPRSDMELLGMRLICKERHTNLLLDVGPDKHGLIRDMHVQALMRLRSNYERITGGS
jgi:alpha-L-fucosidase